MTNRFWEIDFFRGLAVVGMILFHLFFDLRFFDILDFSTETLGWFLAPRFIAGAFIFLAGLSMVISFRRRERELSKAQMDFKYLERGLRIFVYGLIITLTMWLYFEETFIVFGILHFIGVSIIFSYLVLKLDLDEELILALAALFLTVGTVLQTVRFDFLWLLWLGFVPENFFMLDYFPLFPWFGVTLLGIYTGRKFYEGSNMKFDLEEVSNSFVNFFAFLGRNSLEIYFLHQPIFIGSILILT